MNLEILGVAVLLTTGLVQVLKDAAKLNTRFAPLASVLVGIGIAGLEVHPFNAAAVILGITVGLTACGLYSGVSTTLTPSDDKTAPSQTGTATAADQGAVQ